MITSCSIKYFQLLLNVVLKIWWPTFWDFLFLFLSHILIWAFSFFCISWPCPGQFCFHSQQLLSPWCRALSRKDSGGQFWEYIQTRLLQLLHSWQTPPVMGWSKTPPSLSCHLNIGPPCILVGIFWLFGGSFSCSQAYQMPHHSPLFSPVPLLTPACTLRTEMYLVTSFSFKAMNFDFSN